MYNLSYLSVSNPYNFIETLIDIIVNNSEIVRMI